MLARMTDAEMAETVGRARMSDAARATLLGAARRGDPGARRSICALRVRQDRDALQVWTRGGRPGVDHVESRVSRRGARVRRRVDVRGILSDPAARRELMVGAIVATQAREGVDTTREQAGAAYDRVQVERAERAAERRRSRLYEEER